MAKLPALQFYPGDWLRDQVSGCSLAAQGLWLRMMILMHDSDRYGYLTMNGSAMPSETIARRCGCSLAEYETLLAELDRAGVPSRTSEGIIFSRRMVRDEKLRKKAREYGRKGGNPKLLSGIPPDNPPLNPPHNAGLKMKKKMKLKNGEGAGGTEPPRGRRAEIAHALETRE